MLALKQGHAASTAIDGRGAGSFIHFARRSRKADLMKQESLTSSPERAREEAMADTDRTVFMVVFDDADRSPEIVIGAKRARYRFHMVSQSWNAHLFGKIASNSRDDPHYADNIELAAAPSELPVAEMRQPVAWRYRFHTDDSLAGKPNVRPWVLIDKEPQSHEDIEVEPLFASCEHSVEAPSAEEIELLTRIDEDFTDCEETDVDYFAMLNLARRGFLECERFVITEKGAKVIYEESNGVAPARGGEHGE
jgi:hypothetical protein